MEADILITFLALMCGLFFIPRLLSFANIPGPVTEFMLGVAVAFWLPGVLDQQFVLIFATIGVIMVFFFAGIEVDVAFLRHNKWKMLLGTLAQLVLLFLVGIGLVYAGFAAIEAFLITVVLITPSAGFIIANLNSMRMDPMHRKQLMADVISAEILMILILIILLKWQAPLNLLFVLTAVTALILILPKIIRFVYTKLLSNVLNIEFSFFFVIALLSAFVTEYLGLHYIIGAFIAGLVIRIFILSLVEKKQLSHERSTQMMEGINFLGTLFVPFYFFYVGMQFRTEYLDLVYIGMAFTLFIVVSLLRMLIIAGFQNIHAGGFFKELRTASMLLPTLMVGFVVADLLHAQGRISSEAFAVLIWYAVFTALSAAFVKKADANAV